MEEQTSPAGDIVLLKEDAIFQRFLPMTRVVKTYPGTDGLVQAVDSVTMNGKILQRPIHKLVKLLEEDHGLAPWGEDVQVPKESPNCLSVS